jgi:hypothetical protein
MALPVLDSVFASSADLPRRQMLAKWLVQELGGSGSVSDFYTLPERYLYAKIAVAAGAPKTEADYISLPARYVWSDIYNAVASASGSHIDWSEKQALGHIAAAYRGDTENPEALATYINWPWRYQVASIIGGFGGLLFLLSPNGGRWGITVDDDGVVATGLAEAGSGSASILLKSPNNSVFSISIDNSGILTSTLSISLESPNNIFLIKVDNNGILSSEKQ